MIIKKIRTKIVENKIKKVLKNYPILFAYLFGSSARGKTGALSDVDIAVYFEN
ncbi:MAG: nucleotidyltransferase domain-containing protein [Candidatus Azambacteria bacterium]|nr:nucleotidyltransferase domain-containing protein [Candidatus Azambacteria bacterium]